MKTKDSISPLTRRRFLRSAIGSAGVLAFPTIIPATALGKNGKAPPSERVAIGIIGTGRRAGSARIYNNLPDTEIVALADPFGRRIESYKKRCKMTDRKLSEYKDFRELLASDVDAVHITTADYWHVPNLLLAARAKKHIYVEKPLGLSIEQCLASREVFEEHKVVVQYGTQNRSTFYVRSAMELMLNGHLGDIRDIYVWCPQGESGGVCKPEPAPEDLDYDLWLGPAPQKPFCQDRCLQQGSRNGVFHIYDYAIGFLAGWGAHPMDQLQWWLDDNGLSIPEEVEATGGLPVEGLFDTLVHWDAKLRYRGGREITFADATTIAKHLPKLAGLKPGSHGTLFVGSEGWVYCARNSVQTSSPALRTKLKEPGPKRVVHSTNHMGNFVDAILGKNKTVTSLASAIRSDIACHLVDQAVRNSGPIQWDNDKMTITNNKEAKAAMHRPMREPWNVLNKKYI